jgi:hypothetical protein
MTPENQSAKITNPETEIPHDELNQFLYGLKNYQRWRDLTEQGDKVRAQEAVENLINLRKLNSGLDFIQKNNIDFLHRYFDLLHADDCTISISYDPEFIENNNLFEDYQIQNKNLINVKGRVSCIFFTVAILKHYNSLGFSCDVGENTVFIPVKAVESLRIAK